MMTPSDLSRFINSMTPERGVFGEHYFRSGNTTLTYSEIVDNLLNKKDEFQPEQVVHLYKELNRKDSQIKLNLFQDILSSINYLFKSIFYQNADKQLEAYVIENIPAAERNTIKRTFEEKSLSDLIMHISKEATHERLIQIGANHPEATTIREHIKKSAFTKEEIYQLRKNEKIGKEIFKSVLQDKFKNLNPIEAREVLLGLTKIERSMFYRLYIEYNFDGVKDDYILQYFGMFGWSSNQERDLYLSELKQWLQERKTL